MIRELASVRSIWSFGSGPSTGGGGGLPPGFLPVAAVLAARGQFGLVLGPLTRLVASFNQFERI